MYSQRKPSYETKITVGCARTILLLIEAKALRLGGNKKNINIYNPSSCEVHVVQRHTSKKKQIMCLPRAYVLCVLFPACDCIHESAATVESSITDWLCVSV